MPNMKFEIKKLDIVDNINSFSCGDNEWDVDIHDFLLDDALTQQKQGLNATWICLRDNQIVGYTTLVSSTLSLEYEEKPLLKKLFNIGEIKRDNIPCGLIAQFGVNRAYQRQGIGSSMLSFIRGAAIDSKFGIKLLTLHVHSNNSAGKIFWESKGFQIFKPASGSTYKFMVYDLFSG